MYCRWKNEFTILWKKNFEIVIFSGIKCDTVRKPIAEKHTDRHTDKQIDRHTSDFYNIRFQTYLTIGLSTMGAYVR